MTALHHHLPVAEGWELTLSDQPPPAAPFQIVTVLRGRGRWSRAHRQQELEASVPWWSTGVGQSWSSEGQAQWLCLAGDRCPIPEWSEGFTRMATTDGPRCCAAAVADARELASIVTDCPFPCELKNLLTRGKSLMLVSKALAFLSQASEQPDDRYDVRFFEDELDRVRQARRLLLDQMENPPSVPDLARLVGLNELKLKAGFHQLWGTTVYGLLRKERLDEARRFLVEGRGNVGEAAFRVGYTNTSHFAEAFKKEFGTAPGTVLRSRSHLPRIKA